MPSLNKSTHLSFQMPPVTNTAHGGNTGTAQYQKNYGSHAYNTGGKSTII